MATDNSTRVTSLPEYQVWKQMRQRCANPQHPKYRLYGARGIIVCPRWQSFKAFWSDMGPCPDDHTLDRLDNDGNYEPTNCRWATRSQQGRNTRYNRLLTHNGKTMCVADWSEATGITGFTIRSRLRRGWSVERIFTTPVKHRSTAPNRSKA